MQVASREGMASPSPRDAAWMSFLLFGVVDGSRQHPSGQRNTGAVRATQTNHENDEDAGVDEASISDGAQASG
jgi:hypothetical protein